MTEPGEKTCPRCAETVKAEARVCRFCSYDFETGAAPAAAAVATPSPKQDGVALGCGVIMLILVIGAIAGGGDAGYGNSSSNVATPAKAGGADAEDRRKGFHCLSDWDGSHEQLVDGFTGQLRDPRSFEHEETRITPVNAAGYHTLRMTYRARNGFGGMNVGQVTARVRNSDCSFTIVSATS